ncbi:MAG: hypothetical protein HZY74_09075 [Brevundimonas sp.]|nr:MAG: hypothetical protein HZY74_09075 [Brevundimonas sp.]
MADAVIAAAPQDRDEVHWSPKGVRGGPNAGVPREAQAAVRQPLGGTDFAELFV